jgi:hypothetical protein
LNYNLNKILYVIFIFSLLSIKKKKQNFSRDEVTSETCFFFNFIFILGLFLIPCVFFYFQEKNEKIKKSFRKYEKLTNHAKYETLDEWLNLKEK